MEINSQLNKLKDFLEDKVCSKVKLKAETKTREYELVNPKCFVFAPREMRLENYPFISIEFDEITDNREEEIYSIQLYVFVFDNGINVLHNNGLRSYYPNKGDGYVTLFNFVTKIRRELIINRDVGKLIKPDMTIKLIEGVAVILFKMSGLAYPQPTDKEIQDFLDL